MYHGIHVFQILLVYFWNKFIISEFGILAVIISFICTQQEKFYRVCSSDAYFTYILISLSLSLINWCDYSGDMSEKDMADSKRSKIPVSRRNILAATGAAVPGVMAGCLGGDETDSSGSDSSENSSGTASGSGEPVMGGTLQWGGSVAVQGLDPHSVTAAASWRVLESITQGLTTVNYDLEVEPQLASDWTVSDDGQLVTFNI